MHSPRTQRVSVTLMRMYGRGVYKFLCVHGYIHVIILPSCTMFDRANSNVKLASSSRVEVLERSSRVRELERSSARVSHIKTRE